MKIIHYFISNFLLPLVTICSINKQLFKDRRMTISCYNKYISGCLILLLFVLSGSSFASGITIEALERENQSSEHTLSSSINIEDCKYTSDSEEWELKYTITNGETDGDLKYYIGENCEESEYRTDDCIQILDTDDSPEVSASFYITVWDLLRATSSSECTSDNSGTKTLWILLFETGQTSDDYILASGSLSFTLDFSPPNDVPSDLTASEGEENITISWEYDGSDSENLKEYHILCAEVESNGDSDGGSSCSAPFAQGGSYFDFKDEYDCKTLTGTTTSSGTVYDLQNDVTYAFAVVVMDSSYNPSPISEVICAVPQPVEDFWEHYRESGGADDGGFCFIATVAYGSYNHPDVVTLRQFRDKILSNIAGGQFLINYYYEHGKKWAGWISNHNHIKSIVKLLLKPAVMNTKVLLWILDNRTASFLLFAIIAFVILKKSNKGKIHENNK